MGTMLVFVWRRALLTFCLSCNEDIGKLGVNGWLTYICCDLFHDITIATWYGGCDVTDDIRLFETGGCGRVKPCGSGLEQHSLETTLILREDSEALKRSFILLSVFEHFFCHWWVFVRRWWNWF